MTETGMSLGTPHYMSPEQAMGERELDGRTDVYALGCVLYEMLAGEPPFTGPTAQAIVAKVVTATPEPISTYRKTIPPAVEAAVHTALQKLPADRFESAKAFQDALTDPAYRPAALPGQGAPVATRRITALTWALAATVVGLLAIVALLATRRPASLPGVPLYATLMDSVFQPGGVAISPDGANIVMASQVGARDLLVRPAGSHELQTLPNTAGSVRPLISPDGNWILFSKADVNVVPSLHRVPITGGTVEQVLDSAVAVGFCDDGALIVARPDSTIARRPASGGAVERLARLDSIEFRDGDVLPGCRGMVFTDGALQGRLMALDFKSGAVSVLNSQGGMPRYVPTGHILYRTRRPNPILMALPFDASTMRATGPPVPVLEGVVGYAVSRSGTFVYGQNRTEATGEQLVWVDATGRTTPLPLQVPDMEMPRLAPDGRHVAVGDFNGRALVLYDVLTGATTRVPGGSGGWEWAPDSRALYVAGGTGVARVRTDGTGRTDTLWRGQASLGSVAPDQSRLAVVTIDPVRGADIDLLRIDGDSTVLEPYLRADWNERQPAISPDGRWLAYLSDETGRYEVYVRAFPVPGDAIRISDSGGAGPAWARDGGAIYYAGQREMVRADLGRAAGTIQVRSRTPLFPHARLEVTTQVFFQQANVPRRWDLAGRDRFLMVNSEEEQFDSPWRVFVITNFFDELRRKTGQR